MYLLELYYANARLNQTGKFIFPCRKGTIPKWKILSSHPREREKLQLMALSMAGTRYLPHIPYPQNRLLNVSKQPLQLKFYLAQHPETEGPNVKYDLIGHGVQLYADGRIKKIAKQKCRYLSPIVEIQKIRDHSKFAKHFMLAYGPDPKAHRDSDDFDFNNPYLRITRFYLYVWIQYDLGRRCGAFPIFAFLAGGLCFRPAISTHSRGSANGLGTFFR